MKASKNCIDIIKKWEGFNPRAYLDVAGHATIGFGTLLHLGSLTDADKKLVWDDVKATAALQVEVDKVAVSLSTLIKVPVTQNQADSLICWTYNLGVGSAKSSSWLTELNKKNYNVVPSKMSLWNKAVVNGKLVEVQGLKNRRLDESLLFMKK